MNILEVSIPIGVGDAIYAKAMLDSVKDRYDKIKLNFNREIIDSYKLDVKYNSFLDEIENLFFNEPPYVLTDEKLNFYGLVDLCHLHNMVPVKPALQQQLCKGQSLMIEEYIVLNTKVRYLSKDHFKLIALEFWEAINELAKRYKIVILGERVIQMNLGYKEFADCIFSLYSEIVDNVPANNLLDLTVPSLGITAPELTHIQQDCLVMNQAKAVITLGVGGGFSMATAVARVIGYRNDMDPIADAVFNKDYPDAIVTKNWRYFLDSLRNV